jgi:hypothetical protein
MARITRENMKEDMCFTMVKSPCGYSLVRSETKLGLR